MTTTPAPVFDHLLCMTDERGTFEHARFGEARPEHGYCTDDVARVLVVATREPHPAPAVRHLAESSLRFLSDAQGLDGDYRNRRSRRGRWQDRPTLEDCWGRSVWGLGTAASHSDADWVRQSATVQFERAARRRSVWPRAMAFAALGAAELLAVRPDHGVARDLITDAADDMTSPGEDADWPWPEARLAYANAVLPEAMIAAGAVLDRPSLLQDGLDLLAWLLVHETVGGHLSATPVGGAGAGDIRPGFDQQPIEVAALADACARAAIVDGHRRWTDGVAAAVAWFLGENDGQHRMWDPQTGGGFDGLHADGANLNQGTESTLALLSTLQHGRRLVTASP
ncbi:glycosyl transferase [soil metagenome]